MCMHYGHAKATFQEQSEFTLKNEPLGPYLFLQHHLISINIYAKYEKIP